LKCIALQFVAVCCNVLQYVAVVYSVLQCVAVCGCSATYLNEVLFSSVFSTGMSFFSSVVYCSVLQCVAVYYSVLL